MKKILSLLFFVLVCTCTSQLFAADEAAFPERFSKELQKAEEQGESRFFGQFIQMLATLAVIIVIIYIVLWVLKRMLYTRVEQENQTSTIKILERRIINPKTTVYILGFSGKAFAIAESMNGITLLGEVAPGKVLDIRSEK